MSNDKGVHLWTAAAGCRFPFHSLLWTSSPSSNASHQGTGQQTARQKAAAGCRSPRRTIPLSSRIREREITSVTAFFRTIQNSARGL